MPSSTTRSSRNWLTISAEICSSLLTGMCRPRSLSSTVGNFLPGARNLWGTWLPSSRALQHGPKNARRYETSFFALFRGRVAIRYSMYCWTTAGMGVDDGASSWSSLCAASSLRFLSRATRSFAVRSDRSTDLPWT